MHSIYPDIIQHLRRSFEMTEVIEVVDSTVAYASLTVAIPLIPFYLRVITALPRTKSTAKAVYMIYQVSTKTFVFAFSELFWKLTVQNNHNNKLTISGRRCNRYRLFIQHHSSNTSTERTSSCNTTGRRNTSRTFSSLLFLIEAHIYQKFQMIMALIYSTRIGQLCTVFLISLNRVIAVRAPTQYHRVCLLTHNWCINSRSH